jgi:hypothetical protein
MIQIQNRAAFHKLIFHKVSKAGLLCFLHVAVRTMLTSTPFISYKINFMFSVATCLVCRFVALTAKLFNMMEVMYNSPNFHSLQ